MPSRVSCPVLVPVGVKVTVIMIVTDVVIVMVEASLATTVPRGKLPGGVCPGVRWPTRSFPGLYHGSFQDTGSLMWPYGQMSCHLLLPLCVDDLASYLTEETGAQCMGSPALTSTDPIPLPALGPSSPSLLIPENEALLLSKDGA